jgi:hypothetical protein
MDFALWSINSTSKPRNRTRIRSLAIIPPDMVSPCGNNTANKETQQAVSSTAGNGPQH